MKFENYNCGEFGCPGRHANNITYCSEADVRKHENKVAFSVIITAVVIICLIVGYLVMNP